MSLLQKLNSLICSQPNQDIIIENEKKFTYSDIRENINLWKFTFKKWGIPSRFKVLVYVKDAVDIVGIYFALYELDCIIIPIDSSFNKASIPSVIKSSKANLVISLQKLDLEDCKRTEYLPSGYVLYWVSYEENSIPYDIFQFLYTSGTTGLPKCVMFSKNNITNNIVGIAKALKLTGKDIVYTPISLMLPAALNTVLLPALISGSKIYVSNATVPGSILKNIRQQGITIFFAVPFYYKLFIDNALCTEDTWQKVRLCLTSSAFLSEDSFVSFYNKTKKGLHSIYCSSEAGTIAYNNSENVDDLCKYVGKPLDGCVVSLKNIDADGLGEIIVRGGMVSYKYFENEELSKKVYDNGWVETGDIGFVNEDGNIQIKGRVSETINIAGHLVNPLEIEQVIIQMEAVKNVVVYKYVNISNNDMIGVKIVVNENIPVCENDIICYCKKVLPSYKIPKKVEFVDDIVVGRYGKKKRIF